MDEVMEACSNFVNTIRTNMPEILNRKAKFHLLLHLASNIRDFGPCACFNTERLVNYYLCITDSTCINLQV